MARRNIKLVDNIMDMLLEISALSWKIGAFISFVFVMGSIYAFNYAQSIQQTNNTMVKSVLEGGLIWVYYFIPLGLLGIAIIFGWKAYKKFIRDSYY
ncbi:MAG TPA: hypothetical protein DCQ49_10555 [Methylophaga sp.]|nr:hypothetical protein [Methylophaga sp.]